MTIVKQRHWKALTCDGSSGDDITVEELEKATERDQDGEKLVRIWFILLLRGIDLCCVKKKGCLDVRNRGNISVDGSDGYLTYTFVDLYNSSIEYQASRSPCLLIFEVGHCYWRALRGCQTSVVAVLQSF
jgi:hypothetical protein